MTKLAKKSHWALVPCPDYDVPAMESWLEAQALRGWFLSKDDGFFLGLACFAPGAPKRVRYRLDAAPKETFLDDFPENKQTAIDLAQELGWECIAEWKEFLIYRCDDETLPELNTDPAVQALSLKRVQSTLSNRVFMTFWYFFVYPVLSFVLQFPAFLLSILTAGTLRFFALLFLTILELTGAVRDWRRLKKLRAHLKAGGRIEHTQENPGWTKRSAAEKIARPMLTGVWIALLISFVVKTGSPTRSTQADLSASPIPAASSYLTLPEEEGESWSEAELQTRTDLLAKGSIYTLEEHAGSFRYDAEYYDMRTPWLAKWLAEDLRRYDTRLRFGRRTRAVRDLSLSPLPADAVYCYVGPYHTLRVIVQKGTKLISADIWWPYESDFPAETVARALAGAIA